MRKAVEGMSCSGAGNILVYKLGGTDLFGFCKSLGGGRWEGV